jgi:hypothetical protein
MNYLPFIQHHRCVTPYGIKRTHSLIKNQMHNKKLVAVIKRSAFLILLLIVAYYVRRDLPSILSRPELIRGLAIFFMVALSGLLFALSLQINKEREQVKKKLGEQTYNWLTKGE